MPVHLAPKVSVQSYSKVKRVLSTLERPPVTPEFSSGSIFYPPT